MKQQVNKKSMILMTMFCTVVLAIVCCFISVTHTFFGDVKSGNSGNIVIATLDFNATCPIKLGIVEPNTTYEGADYQTTITNTGNSRYIFVRVKVESSLDEKLVPIYDTDKWARGGANNNEYYYLGALNSKDGTSGTAESVVFNTGFKTLNTFTNADAGKSVNVRLTVYALQAQYYAFEDTSNGWKTSYTPSAFITYYNSVKDTFK